MSVLIVGQDEGERLSPTTEIKAGREELVVVEFLYPPGKRGPDLHVHREHWMLLGARGRADLPARPRRRGSTGGSRLLRPRAARGRAHLPQRRAGPRALPEPPRPRQGVRRLPAGHGRGQGLRLRQLRPPEDGGRPVSEAVLLEAGEEQAIGREHGIGSLALSLEHGRARIPGPALHLHERMVDSFFVLDGNAHAEARRRRRRRRARHLRAGAARDLTASPTAATSRCGCSASWPRPRNLLRS